MKRLTEYQAIIVDLDGTLYFQKPVRMAMLNSMALHFWKFRDFLIIQKYRKLSSRIKFI
jgi:beta-phosphoglucomutase-like phosphatase (HAD superfamily)